MRRRGVGPGRPAMRRGMRRRRRRRVMLMGGFVALGAHKMKKSDVEKVEAHTGQSADELSDEELQTAMTELNIQPEPLTEQDQAAVAEAAQQDDGDDEVEE